MTFTQRLAQAVRSSKSVICVGLDPRQEQLPTAIRDGIVGGDAEAWAAAYREFCVEILDVVAGQVACVKPQTAFFEQLGPPGMIALGDVIAQARRRGLLVIADGKRNDIGSTAAAYADGFLGGSSAWGCDALTVSPYLGRDSLEPFVETCAERDAGIFVLVKTSNPGGGLLQDRESQGQTVYQRVAETVTELNVGQLDEAGYGPVGAVVGATYPQQLAELRRALPQSWILVPGFGAQGGSAADVAGAFDAAGLGAVVNSSRHLIFAHQRPEFRDRFARSQWQQAVAAAVAEMNQQLAGRGR